MMEWSDVRVFLQVVREGTMIAATASLRMDHSTISRRIARLEVETGVSLFDRAGRRLVLTAEGAQLVAAAEKMESIILREVMSISDGRDRIVGTVRIGTTEEFGAHYLASRLAGLTAAHPGLEIELVALPRSFSLATREVDLVVTLDRPATGDIRYKKLTDFEFGVYCSPSYYEGRELPTSVDELAGETWCGHIDELLFTQELDARFLAPGGAPARYRTTSMTVQLGAALGGYALAALPCFVAEDEPDLLRILRQEAVCERTYWLAVHDDLSRYPRVRALMSAIETQVAVDRALFMPSLRAELGAKAAGLGAAFPQARPSTRDDPPASFDWRDLARGSVSLARG
jgi:DNA-binding transcriptional LysR family regulator